MPINNIAEIADKFTRNEILTSNEIRQIVGFKPAGDPKADQLVNSNMPQPEGSIPTETVSENSEALSVFDDMDSVLDNVFNDLGVDTEAESEDAIMQDAFDEMDSAIDDVFNDLGLDE